MKIETAIIVTEIPFVTQEDKFLALKICKILSSPFPVNRYFFDTVFLEVVKSRNWTTFCIEKHTGVLFINQNIHVLLDPKNHRNYKKVKHICINYKDFLRNNKVSTIDYLTRSKK